MTTKTKKENIGLGQPVTKIQTKTKVSKTWLAFEKLIGTGKIVDMKAVLK